MADEYVGIYRVELVAVYLFVVIFVSFKVLIEDNFCNYLDITFISEYKLPK